MLSAFSSPHRLRLVDLWHTSARSDRTISGKGKTKINENHVTFTGYQLAYRRLCAIEIVVPIAYSVFLIEARLVGAQMRYSIALLVAHVKYLKK